MQTLVFQRKFIACALKEQAHLYFSRYFYPHLIRCLLIALLLIPKDAMIAFGRGILNGDLASGGLLCVLILIQSFSVRDLFQMNPNLHEYLSSLPIHRMVHFTLFCTACFFVQIPLMLVVFSLFSFLLAKNLAPLPSILKFGLFLPALVVGLSSLIFAIATHVHSNPHFGTSVPFSVFKSPLIKLTVSKIITLAKLERKNLIITLMFSAIWLALMLLILTSNHTQPFELYSVIQFVFVSIPLLMISRYFSILSNHDREFGSILLSLPIPKRILIMSNVAICLFMSMPILSFSLIGKQTHILLPQLLLCLGAFILFRVFFSKNHTIMSALLITFGAWLLC